MLYWIRNKPLKACTTLNIFTTMLAFSSVFFFGHKAFYLLALPAAIIIIFSIFVLIQAKSFLLGITNFLAVIITQTAFLGILCAIGFAVSLFLSSDPTKPMKWFTGERIENFFESRHFKRLNEFGFAKKIESMPIHASYYLIADDYGFDVFFELSKENLSKFIPGNMNLIDQDKFINEERYEVPSNYFLCIEDTEALLTNKQLIDLVCNDEKANVGSLHHHQSLPEKSVKFNLVYFPDNQILWIHYLKW